MTREDDWKREWEELRAERERARRQWRGAVKGLAARIRDPLGIGGLVREHPLASAGIGAALGALLAKALFNGSAPPRGDGARNGEAPPPPSAWKAALRDAALGIAVPWLLRVVKERFGGDAGPSAAEERATPASRGAP